MKGKRNLSILSLDLETKLMKAPQKMSTKETPISTKLERF